MADTTAKARTFRLGKDTNDQIAAIGKLLNENDTEVLIRAVKYLYDNRKDVAEAVFKERLGEIKAD